MKITADLHIHSKYSRATARNLDLENIYQAALLKGISLVGTGDFTHPAWLDEIKQKLVPAEPGLFKLKKTVSTRLDREIPKSCRGRVRFILQTEISSIYKKNDKVRKNHNLVFFPDIDSVTSFDTRLDKIGNIKSDGRPILGLDARDLLEIMLEINEKGMFVPAHIWTPWFSLFGSKSGFDSIDECFSDLSSHIFAVETGLSSDPPMNWRVPQLDDRRLISCSDAHSPMYLGRNASVFTTQLSFFHIRQALAIHDMNAYGGTLDMYPEEGKYHYDGHRKCGICLDPEKTREHGGRCPVCGRPLTLGVLYRVRELAQRPDGYQPQNRHGFRYIIPLTDILAQIFMQGPKTKKVAHYYNKAITLLGPELTILLDTPLADIEKTSIPLLALAIGKMRAGDVIINPGYDGEFGKVVLFSEKQRQAAAGHTRQLFNARPAEDQGTKQKKSRVARQSRQLSPPQDSEETTRSVTGGNLIDSLNPEQQLAVFSDARRTIINAGPGTGKTRTLIAKMAWLISEKKTPPSRILALTFTNKAANEIKQRLTPHLSKTAGAVETGTFHSFCLAFLRQYRSTPFSVADDVTRKELVKEAARINKTRAGNLDHLIGLCKQNRLSADDDLADVVPVDRIDSVKLVFKTYEELCSSFCLVDFEGLISMTLDILETERKTLEEIQDRFSYIFVDEYQDINKGQYLLTRLISRKSRLLVIGDPDQSIYGFRGSDPSYFKLFTREHPDAERITLKQNYRSTQTILDASFQMINGKDPGRAKTAIFSDDTTSRKLVICETASEQAEAAFVGKTIEHYIGGTSFFSMDASKTDSTMDNQFSFADFAVLYRTRKQGQAFFSALEKHGIPCQTADKVDIFSQEGIRELISLMRVLYDKATFIDNKIVDAHLACASGVKDSIEFLKALALSIRKKTFTRAVDCLARKSGLHDLIQANDRSAAAYQDILDFPFRHAHDIPLFLDRLALNQDPDQIDTRVEKVSLMTLHASKGLEFPVVFITGCEQGLIPYARPGNEPDDIDEERRLFYVGMTRARRILCLTYAKKRRIFGLEQKQNRSTFLSDVEDRLKQYVRPEYKKRRTAPAARQMDLFGAGHNMTDKKTEP